ncbi:trypsin-like peptidase domain-containing protein [Desulfohalobiaceae bacterium Ax17]|uniref:trypsin-like peptidase domain-containing protein n=1 Tax=Desulfovulcanus ferrireducens TaxID=2831190 RepID=UPI00207BC04D|nr:trypsin-like peptidase domain-containing protein [Desulfovulcanus ferrireducens]MBT8762324.1 trypsin-like peptidase domain-containing protein [Desulfovulcanus ferrireducens]
MRLSRALLLLCFFCCPHLLWAGGTDNALRYTPVVRAVQKVAPAVVNIHTKRIVEQKVNPFRSFFGESFPLWEEFLGPGFTRRYVQKSLGSGVIIDHKERLILTNAHVIEGASSITARLLDGREFKAELVGSDPDFDLAILRLDGKSDLPQVEMGNSDGLMIGETVIAIGNPFGFSHTVTTGVISALHRSIKTKHGLFTDFIQTDAAINPGNSGGPLLNILGQLIGLNTAIYAEAQGIGFAIPINKAKRVKDELIHFGRIQPVWLGLCAQSMDQQMASYFGLDRIHGLVITEVFANTPAQEAGLKPGDVLLKLDEYPVEDKDQYLQLLKNYTQGQKIALTILRQGKELIVSVKTSRFLDKQALELAYLRWGIKGVKDYSGHGIRVQEIRPRSPAAKLGLAPGDILVKIGGVAVKNVQDLARAFKRYRLKNTILLLVIRAGQGYYVRLRV